MRQIFAVSAERASSKPEDDGLLEIVGKISDDRMKLFIDAQLKPRKTAAETPAAETASLPSHAPSHAPSLAPSHADSAAFQKFSRDEILEALKQHVDISKVNLGVIDDIVQCLQRGDKVVDRRIVRGVDVVDGADGKLVLLVRPLGKKLEFDDQDSGGQVRSLHSFDNVLKGMAVARVYQPKQGTDGVDALGKAIKSRPGKPAKVTIDKTVSRRSVQDKEISYDELCAEVDGYLSAENGAVKVNPELIVKGNLDHRYGSLDFVGAVSVQGDVLPGFSITAGQSITVRGSVRGASLTSKQGNIVVQGFVFGGAGAGIVCSGNFTCRTAQEAHVEARGSITVEREILNCVMRALGTVVLTKGALVGGHAFAGCGVEADQIGSQVGTETWIHLSSSIEVTLEFGQLIQRIESHDKAIKLLELHLGPYATNRARVQLLKPEYRKKMQDLLDRFDQVQKSRVSLVERKKNMLEGAKINSKLLVNFRGAMFDGVHVTAAGVDYVVKQELKGPASLEFLASSGEFQVHDMQPLQCELVQPQATNRS